MQTPSIIFKSTFVQSDKTLTVELTDTFTAAGIDLANVKGCIKIEAPTGIVYNNTDFDNPDLDSGNSFIKTGLVLPQNSVQKIMKGEYTVTVTVQVSDFEKDVTLFSYDNTEKQLVLTGNYTSEVNNATVLGVYDLGGLVQAVTLDEPSTFGSGKTTATVVALSLTEDPEDYYLKITYDLSLVQAEDYDFQWDDPEVKIDVVADCNCAKLTSTDNTEYGDYISLTREHRVVYPVTSGQEDYVSSLKQIVLNQLWTKVYQIVVTTTALFQDNDNGGYYIQSVLEGQKDCEVTCDDAICSISTCINTLLTQYAASLSNNPTKASSLQQLIIQTMSNWMGYSLAIECGLGTETQFVTNIKTILNIAGISCGCGCDDVATKSIKIVPTCGAGSGGEALNIILESATAGITIEAVIDGNDKTFTLTLVNEFILDNIVTPAIEATNIGDLADVNDDGKAIGNVFQWDGTNWIAVAITVYECSAAQLLAGTLANKYVSPRRILDKIIFVFDAANGYKQGQMVLYTDRKIYLLITDSTAGMTPVTNPSIFKPILGYPYKEIVINLNQTSTAAPTAYVFQQDIAGSVTTGRLGVGNYRVQLTGAFPAGFTVVIPGSARNINQVEAFRDDDDTIIINTFDITGAAADDVLIDTALIVRVYPT